MWENISKTLYFQENFNLPRNKIFIRWYYEIFILVNVHRLFCGITGICIIKAETLINNKHNIKNVLIFHYSYAFKSENIQIYILMLNSI